MVPPLGQDRCGGDRTAGVPAALDIGHGSKGQPLCPALWLGFGDELQFWLDFTIKFISLFYDLILGESSRQSPRHVSQTALSSDMAHG